MSQNAITRSARGEQCQVRIPGCTHDPEQTVFAHANGSAAGKGIGMKAPPYLGAYACWNCHRIYDRQASAPEGWTRVDVELAFCEGVFRTQQLLERKGLLVAA